ncbi:MAG: PcfJ domain-containing protein [Bacteroides sp.]
MVEKIKEYSRYEQYFSAGIKDLSFDIEPNITEIPNGLLKLCKDYELRLTNELYRCYKADPDFFTVAFSTEFTSLTAEDLLKLLTYGCYISRYTKAENSSYLHAFHSDYNYNIKSLLVYFDNLYTYEALEDVNYMIRELLDYVKMMSRISPKYDKYPKNFLTSRKIAIRNYTRLKEKFVEEDFQKRIDNSLGYSSGEYQIIYPKTTQEIKDEAVQQHHCVASYIKKVIDGECHILFLRKKESLEKSLVTLEIRNNKVVQARGKFDREMSKEEQNVVDKYNRKIERLAIAC